MWTTLKCINCGESWLFPLGCSEPDNCPFCGYNRKICYTSRALQWVMDRIYEEGDCIDNPELVQEDDEQFVQIAKEALEYREEALSAILMMETQGVHRYYKKAALVQDSIFGLKRTPDFFWCNKKEIDEQDQLVKEKNEEIKVLLDNAHKKLAILKPELAKELDGLYLAAYGLSKDAPYVETLYKDQDNGYYNLALELYSFEQYEQAIEVAEVSAKTGNNKAVDLWIRLCRILSEMQVFDGDEVVREIWRYTGSNNRLFYSHIMEQYRDQIADIPIVICELLGYCIASKKYDDGILYFNIASAHRWVSEDFGYKEYIAIREETIDPLVVIKEASHNLGKYIKWSQGNKEDALLTVISFQESIIDVCYLVCIHSEFLMKRFEDITEKCLPLLPNGVSCDQHVTTSRCIDYFLDDKKSYLNEEVIIEIIYIAHIIGNAGLNNWEKVAEWYNKYRKVSEFSLCEKHKIHAIGFRANWECITDQESKACINDILWGDDDYLKDEIAEEISSMNDIHWFASFKEKGIYFFINGIDQRKQGYRNVSWGRASAYLDFVVKIKQFSDDTFCSVLLLVLKAYGFCEDFFVEELDELIESENEEYDVANRDYDAHYRDIVESKALNDDPESLFLLGLLHRYGWFNEKSDAKAKRYIKKAASLGIVYAQDWI